MADKQRDVQEAAPGGGAAQNSLLAPGRLALLALAMLGVAAFYWLDGASWLNLEALKSSRERLHALYAARPAAVLCAYFVLYVAVAALNLPGAIILTLAGSAIFGFWTGLVAVSFASSLGATLACALSRYVLRGWVRARFGAALSRIDAGLSRDGPWYLLSLRLVPVFPFFLINLVMGVTSMPLFTFYWVSQVGMLAGTAVFVNAGKEIGRLESAGDIMSPGLWAALVLLAAFPLMARWALGRLRR